MIELEAASLAATRSTPEDIEALAGALAILDEALDDPRRFTQADIEFHDAILRATKNHLLPRLFDQMRPLLEFGREISVDARPQGPSVTQAGHRAIFDAIRSGSPAEARREMEDHLSWTADLDFSERSVPLALDRAQHAPDAEG
jgi:DNA-binding FadR family transcriptional regulator